MKENTVHDEQHIQILLVEDNPGDVALLQQLLSIAEDKSPHTLHHVDRLAAACDFLHEHDADIILLDLSLPDSYDIDTFISLSAHVSGTPVIILTGNRDQELAQIALQRGAEDYLVKEDLNLRMIWRVLRFSLERARLKKNLMLGEERLRTLIEENRDGIVIVDELQIVRYINPASVKMLPKVFKPVIGELFPLNFQPEDSVQKNITGENEEEHVIDIAARNIEWQGDKVYMITLRDLTEQKRAEEVALKEVALRHIQEMAGAICHEFSQPLQTLSLLYGMETDNHGTQQNREVFKRVMSQLKTLLNNLRSIDRIAKQDYLDSQIIDLHNSSQSRADGELPPDLDSDPDRSLR